jgi:PadR family transcriptional regulator, regulatory protein PadR
VARRLSPQAVAVLQALASEPGRWRHGYELGRRIDLKAGSLYPILMRLHDRGLLESSWETDPPTGRPPRHLYRLTATGARLATETASASDRTTVSERRVRRPTVRREAWDAR